MYNINDVKLDQGSPNLFVCLFVWRLHSHYSAS